MEGAINNESTSFTGQNFLLLFFNRKYFLQFFQFTAERNTAIETRLMINYFNILNLLGRLAYLPKCPGSSKYIAQGWKFIIPMGVIKIPSQSNVLNIVLMMFDDVY